MNETPVLRTNHRNRRVATDNRTEQPLRSGDVTSAYLQTGTRSGYSTTRSPYGLEHSAAQWEQQVQATASAPDYHEILTLYAKVRKELAVLKQSRDVLDGLRRRESWGPSRAGYERELRKCGVKIVNLRWAHLIGKAAQHERTADLAEAFALKISTIKISYFQKANYKFLNIKNAWTKRDKIIHVCQKVYEFLSLLFEIYFHFVNTRAGAAASAAAATAATAYLCKNWYVNEEIEDHSAPTESPGEPDIPLLTQ
jgi:hypothetical protein